MRKLLLALALVPMLSACPGPISVGSPPPTIATVIDAVDDTLNILDRTTVDEHSFIAALASFDVGLTAVDGLISIGKIKRDTPFALELKRHLLAAQTAFRIAKKAHGKEYLAALVNARAALKRASNTLKQEQ